MLLVLMILTLVAALLFYLIEKSTYSDVAYFLFGAMLIAALILCFMSFTIYSCSQKDAAFLNSEYISIVEEAKFLEAIDDGSTAIAHQKYQLNERIEKYNSKYSDYQISYVDNIWTAGLHINKLENLTTLNKIT